MSIQEQIEGLAEDDETISDIADEAGLSSEDGEEILRDALDRMAVDERFRDEKFSVQESPYDYSLTEHIKSTLSVFTATRRFPSHGRVTGVKYEDGMLSLDVEIIGGDFTTSFEFSPDDDSPPEKLAYLYDQTGSTLYKPSSIVDETVPVTYSNGYQIHYPPESPGVVGLVQYKIVRVFRRFNMIKIKNGSNGLTKTGWGYFVVLSMLLVAGIYASGLASGAVLGFIITVLCIPCLGYIKTALFE